MKTGSLEYEVKFNTDKAKKGIAELTKKVEALGLAFTKYRNVEIEYSIVEKKKKKWYQFWK